MRMFMRRHVFLLVLPMLAAWPLEESTGVSAQEQRPEPPVQQLAETSVLQPSDLAGAVPENPRMVRESKKGPPSGPDSAPASGSAVVMSLGAGRNSSGAWTIKVSAGGNMEQREHPLILIDSRFEEALPHSDRDGWVEMSATATVSGLRSANYYKQPAPKPIKKPPPPESYGHIPGFGYYKIYQEEKTYLFALRTCEAEGAHLLIINSAEEVRHVLWNAGFTSWIWVGFEERSKNNFITVLDEPLESTGYMLWDIDEPTEEEHCGAAKRNGVLGTASCTSTRGFICEYAK